MRALLRLSILAAMVLLVLSAPVASDVTTRSALVARFDSPPIITNYPAAPFPVELIWQANGDSAGDYFGFSVAGNGDWDGDGDPDILVGAMLADRDTHIDVGSVSAYYYNGLGRGNVYYGQAGSNFGRSVRFVGDLDDNGTDECLVGAPGFNSPSWDSAGFVTVHKAFGFSILFSQGGQQIGEKLGYCVASAGDVDNDGYDDILAGAPEADGITAPRMGYVLLISPRLSGPSGPTVILHRYDGLEPYALFGRAVAGAGDVNGDHVEDVIIGAPLASVLGSPVANVGAAFVYGIDGSLIWRYNGENPLDYFGNSVANAGDVDNDGTPDIIIGAWHADPAGVTDAGSAYVYSGATHALLWKFNGEGPSHNFGYSVAGLGDVDRDGYDDLVIGAHRADPDSRTDAGAVYVYSGQDGSLLWKVEGAMADDLLGVSVALAGDITRDGNPDFLVGAFGTDPDGRVNSGSAYLFGSPCACPSPSDLDGNTFIDAVDLALVIDIVFYGAADVHDTNCPVTRADFDASGFADAVDLALVIDHVFFGAAGPTDPCTP